MMMMVMMMASPISPNLSLRPQPFQWQKMNFHDGFYYLMAPKPSFSFNLHHYHFIQNCKLRSARSPVLGRRGSDGVGEMDATLQRLYPSDIEDFESVSPNSGDGYVGLFAQMLGTDNDPRDREQAVNTLWKFSLGGNHCIDKIMQYRGCINLTVNLLKSDSSSTCEAAAGLLRTISSVNIYRDSVGESGAIEEITGLLSRSSLTSEVKEQILCTLWNLSVDEKFRMKIANIDLLPALIKSLDDDVIEIKEAAGGVLANLALSYSNHQIMVEAGVIPKLAKFLKGDEEESHAKIVKGEKEETQIIMAEARNALLEFAKNEYYRILIIEEGFVSVPLVGEDAYKCLKAVAHSQPSLPDGTEFERTSSKHSMFGASELLLGLNRHEKNLELEEAKANALLGRMEQQFLVRTGAIEREEGRKPQSESPKTQQSTLLPLVDGIARLVLILELEDPSAISRAAQTIADASINEHMRISFLVAGAIKYLVQLLIHDNENVKLSACHALERLSVSNSVCRAMEVEGAVSHLINALRNKEISENLMEKTMCILSRILDPGKEMKLKIYKEMVNGSEETMNATKGSNVHNGLTMHRYEMELPKEATREIVSDFFVISRLVEILKTSSPNLQAKAASVLEYIASAGPCKDTLITANLESGLSVVFQERLLNDEEDDMFNQQPELSILEAEEAGMAISAASRLLTKLLDYEKFRRTINSNHFIHALRGILKSGIPLQSKDSVAACLVKLQSLSGSILKSKDLISLEVTLYQTIPRLIEQIKTTFSPEVQEAAVIELNTIISEGVVDCSRAVAAQGGIFPLVKVMEEGNKKAVEASLAILYNLSMDSENHSAIIAAGAVPALRRIVLSQGPQWTYALNLLRNLPTC